MLFAAAAAQGNTCRSAFRLPAGWTSEPIEADNGACLFELRPPGWQVPDSDSRTVDPPLSMLVFAEKTDFDDALEQAGFSRNSRDRIGIEDPYGTFTRAEKVRVGRFAGYAAFVHDTRVFSGAIGHWILRELHGPIVAFECSGGSPEMKVDCNEAIETMTRSLKRE